MYKIPINITENDYIKLQQLKNHPLAWEKWNTPHTLIKNFIKMGIEEYEKALKERLDWYNKQNEVILKSDKS